MSARGVGVDVLTAMFLRHWSDAHDLEECIRLVAVAAKSQRCYRAELQEAARKRAAARRVDRCRESTTRLAAGQAIVELVARARDMETAQLTGNGGWAKLARARHEAAWLMSATIDEITFDEIGEVLGRRKKTAAHYAVTRVQAFVDADPGYGAELRAIGAGITRIRRAA